MTKIISIEEGRKEDGNRSIADKILKRLNDLEKMNENKGRWAWELLQNAKDSLQGDKKVSIEIEICDDAVMFRHNGAPFTEKDIRGLINQISSKEVENNENSAKTGKFGTGFLTTHLLSKIISVQGIVQTQTGQYYQFLFDIDREGKTTSELIPKIEATWEDFHSNCKHISSDEITKYATTFTYPLRNNAQKEMAVKGIAEVHKLVPYILIFNPSIENIQITFDNQSIVYQRGNQTLNGLITPIIENTSENKKERLFLHHSTTQLMIAVEIEKKENIYYVKKIANETPRLFCDFPLIGTEKFSFPIIINSHLFNPLTERDGIWLNSSDDIDVLENKSLIQEATELYKRLINDISTRNFYHLFNIAETNIPNINENYFDKQWYQDSIQNTLREFIFEAPIVDSYNDGEKRAIKDLYFPPKEYSREIRQQIWQYSSNIYPHCFCKLEDLNFWCDLSWPKWNKQGYEQLLYDVSHLENIASLKSLLGKDTNPYEWIMNVYDFVIKDSSNLSLTLRSPIIPNKNNNFKLLNHLYIDSIQDEQLINILIALGENWNDLLVHPNIFLPEHKSKNCEEIANKITQNIRADKQNTLSNNLTEAILLLSKWFDDNEEKSKLLFRDLFSNRATLFMNTISDKESLYKIMRSKTELSDIANAIEKNTLLVETKNELDNLLTEFSVDNIDQLRNLINQSTASHHNHLHQPIEITQETLAYLGIGSKKEFDNMMNNKNISSNLKHDSTPTTEMFLFAKQLIDRAKLRVKNHLLNLTNYDCTDIEEISTTVLGGIKKDNEYIYIVVRPSDYGQVIIYYDAEKDVLDYETAELWIDNGKDLPQQLTLGKILKNTGITRIPV